MPECPKNVLVRLLVDQPHGKKNDELVVSENTAHVLCDSRGTAERLLEHIKGELLEQIIAAKLHSFRGEW